MRKVIVNSTPLIALFSIGKLDLLKELYGKVYIPFGVFEEVCLEGSLKIEANIIQDSSFIVIELIKNEEARKMFKPSLHKGEVRQ